MSVESVFAIQNFQLSPFEEERNTPDFSFAAVGDMGCSLAAKKIANDMNNKTPELILAFSDLSYQRSSVDCWLNFISPIDDRMKIVLGDHDYGSDSLLKQYKNYFNLSQEYYSFNYQNVHFVALATEKPFDMNSPQYNFVKNDLGVVSKNPDIKWIVVYSYRPQYSSPSMHPGNGDLRDTYHPLFQKYNVDLVLQAHNHNYQRSYPMKYNKATPSQPIVADVNSNYYRDPSGQIYVTVGTGGAQLHRINGDAPYVAAQYTGFGFLDISLINNGKTLTGIFYASNDDSIKDTFTMIK